VLPTPILNSLYLTSIYNVHNKLNVQGSKPTAEERR
jgi:hypothetical protein